MMNKKRTRTAGRIKYALFAPLAAALLLVSNIEAVARTVEKAIKEQPAPTDALPQDNPQQEAVVQICEELPQFPGGTSECMKFLGKNIKYPAEAIAQNIEGRVIAQMIIEKDGSVSNVKIVKSVHPLLDKEAIRVIESMPKWIPGRHKGKTVRVQYTLPIAFHTQKDKKADFQTKTGPDENGVHTIVDTTAEFPGGMQNCLKFIQESIKYPEDCKKEGIQGRVIVQFVIEKDGSIKDVKVVRGVHPSLDKESIRVIESMPKWIPGKVKGEPVVQKYTLPIMFHI